MIPSFLYLLENLLVKFFFPEKRIKKSKPKKKPKNTAIPILKEGR